MHSILRKAFVALMLCPMVAFAALPVNINEADAVALEQINGVGPAKAAAIVSYRDQNGPFRSVDELQNVPGIGSKSLEQIRPQVKLDEAQKK